MLELSRSNKAVIKINIAQKISQQARYSVCGSAIPEHGIPPPPSVGCWTGFKQLIDYHRKTEC